MDMTSDARIAEAMNRVLEAERAAGIAIAECERKMQALHEQARQTHRTILERAQQRIVALHARAEHRLERRAAQILSSREAPAARGGQAVDEAWLQAAIEVVMERITGAGRDQLDATRDGI